MTEDDIQALRDAGVIHIPMLFAICDDGAADQLIGEIKTKLAQHPPALDPMDDPIAFARAKNPDSLAKLDAYFAQNGTKI